MGFEQEFRAKRSNIAIETTVEGSSFFKDFSSVPVVRDNKKYGEALGSKAIKM